MKETVQKRVRQTTTVLIALALVLSILGPIGTVGAQSVSVSNTPETTTAAPGETVSISTTISGSDINGQGVQVFLPEKWQGTITDADGGTPKPESESANVLEVVWLSNGTYTVSYDVQVPADATEGDYTVDVEGSGIDPSTEDRVTDTAQTTIAVEESNGPPVADAGDDQTVDEGDSVTLDASNSSDPDGDSLSYSWTQTAGTSVNLSDSSSATPTFTAPEVDEDETLTFEVEVDDGNGGTDTDTVDVTVQNVPDPENFQVSNLSAPDSATQGDAIDVSADITNSGEQTATQTVELRLDGDDDGTLEVLTDQGVTLDAGETQTVTFGDVDTSGLDAGEYDHGVFTENDSATATITIEEPEPDPANFQVSNLSAPDSATQGEAIDVTADIENTGGQTATKPVEFRVDVDGDGFGDDDDVVTTQDVQLDPGQSTTVEFTDIDTSGLPVDTYTHGVVTEDDNATAQITINAPAEASFQVSNLSAPDSATQGEAIDVTADVTNDGGQQATQTVEFRLDVDGNGTLEGDEALASQNVTLGADETQTVTFSDIDTSGLDAGEYEHGVFTDDDSETAILSVEKAPLPPVDDFENSPTDPDDDGLYEDVNGDGEFNIVDVQALFANLDDETVQNNPDAFDFNQDGGVDVVDVQKLYNEVLQ